MYGRASREIHCDSAHGELGFVELALSILARYGPGNICGGRDRVESEKCMRPLNQSYFGMHSLD